MSEAQIQAAGFLLELSPDWLVQRASCNAHAFLGEYHQRLVGGPISTFTMAQVVKRLRPSKVLSLPRTATGKIQRFLLRQRLP